MKILAIDTSCDETAAAVTEGLKVLSNVMWSQASEHAKWGGVVPSVAQRAHSERIEWVVNTALKRARTTWEDVKVIAVTAGPGLGIALGVGIAKAKELALKHDKKLIKVNHVEGHALSAWATTSGSGNEKPLLPCLALVASGKHSEIILIERIGEYTVLAKTIDDAIGEALDKAARMLGLGYPGGALLEKMARKGNQKKYELPTPMLGQENRLEFSYSGLKTAMWRLVEQEKPLTPQKVADLGATFQNKALMHIEKILKKVLVTTQVKDLVIGGGVAANLELRKRLRKICRDNNMKLRLPYSMKLCGDNAAMIGVVAGFKAARGEFIMPEILDRLPRWKIDEVGE